MTLVTLLGKTLHAHQRKKKKRKKKKKERKRKRKCAEPYDSIWASN